ncbi:hypothetical protein AB0K40_18050 [Nonomuraea bangladeshensis]|uniref:Uncharacterized protein n=1 Tax=Nonomuraea bangladeshensis TaxID=404385 RepID=A0ABV3H4I8_9ACTN
MSTFTPEWDGLPSEDDISAYLSTLGDDGPGTADRRHPYEPLPASDRPRPSWRDGPPIGPDAERAYLDEQDDCD